MTASELIVYIYENNKIETILNALDCFSVKEYNKEFRCGLPNDTSKTRVRVKNNEYLNITIFQSDDKKIRGNIITLAMYIKNYNFPQANKYLHEILGLKYKFNKKKIKSKKETPLDIFKKVKKKRKKYNVTDLDIYTENFLKEFTPNLHINWLKEGILSFTAREFNIGYDYKRKRIIIPHRKWSGERDEYLGFMGRTTIEEYELLDIPKYYPIKPYPKGLNLYGLQENYKYIQEAGYISVFEAEKSVLKRHSRLDKTGVALCCHDITDEQVSILIGLNVEIVIILDQGIKLEHIWRICDKFYGIRKVSYIYDKYNILKNKESPADMHNKIYNSLFKYRKIYDENDRRKYLQWVENQKKI